MVKKSDTIAIQRTHLFLAVGLLVGLFGGFLIWDVAGVGDGGSTGNIVAQQPNPTPTQDAPSTRYEVSTDDDPFLGDENAPVTVIEFSDFECPFCGRAYSDAVAGIKSDYIDNGQVKFVYRDFPLSFHPQATPAAEAAECADDQGKFWEFHDALFEGQNNLSDSFYSQVAGNIGLDVSEFDNCYNSREHADEVSADQADGAAVGVSGTPTFFIGNDEDGYVRIVGAQPYTTIKQAIEAEL